MTSQDRRPVCIVAGVGPGNGEAFARRYAAEGYSVGLLARRATLISALEEELPGSRAYVCDVADEASVNATIKRVRTELSEIDVLIYNAGKGVWGNIEKVSPADFEQAWRVNTLGLFLTARAAIPSMRTIGRGTLIVTGATASRRGVAGTAAFAPAKAAQRALTESMARHLGPSGIHVALIIVDGVVGGPETRQMFADRPDEAFIEPEAIADIAMHLTRQDRSAWTFEMDARPFNEKW